MKTYLLNCILILIACSPLWAIDTQDTLPVDHKLKLNIYLDCQDCDYNYLKENISCVNFVREQTEADVQIFVSTLKCINGSTQYHAIYYGKKQFQSHIDTIVFQIDADYTLEKTRRTILKKIELGLVPYLLKTPYANSLYLTIDNISGKPGNNNDPWKNWLFTIYGSASLFRDNNTKSYRLNANFFISKITVDKKYESENYLAYNSNTLHMIYEDSVGTHIYNYKTEYKEMSTKNLYVKSVDEHFGIGGFANFRNSKLNNINFQVKIGPAIEYNLFNYRDASQKQLRFLYFLGYELVDYNELTINNKKNDFLCSHNVRILFMYVQPWGYVHASLSGINYLNDLSLLSLGAHTMTNIRLGKGFSFNISCGLNMYRAQLELKKGLAGLEEVLTQQQEMARNYSFSMNIGLSYRFGSKFIHVVNPRFSF
jgi:hypothetical protein